jgi:hypothetical protein
MALEKVSLSCCSLLLLALYFLKVSKLELWLWHDELLVCCVLDVDFGVF